MKIYIILTLIALTLAEEWKLKTVEEWKQIYMTCDQRHQVAEEFYQKSRTEKYPPKEVFEVVLCTMRSMEVWSDTEGFSVDKMMIALDSAATQENVDKKFIRDSLESCADKNTEGSTPLDWAYRCFKCFKDNEKFFKVLREARFFDEQSSDYVDSKE
uniref:OBP7 n=1 Tax=Episyrphus balteatus TaxID=286459 RepID=A0A6H0D2Y0_EPIBA|nr:OBP7 [Episyrphus balteatus]